MNAWMRSLRIVVAGLAFAALATAPALAQQKTISNSGSTSQGTASAFAISPGGGGDMPRQAPALSAPTIIGGPCIAPVSAGVSTPFGGAAFGIGNVDPVCQFHTIGADKVAFE